jgi:GDP-L-fucose synthase
MKLLITGGNGLVGKAIQEVLKKSDYTLLIPSSRECNLENEYETQNYFKRNSPDLVIHLAANVGGLYKNMNEKVQMLEKNVKINMNVLKCAHEYGIKKVISCLSTCIFPNKTTYPIHEKMLHDGPPHCSNDAYAHAKRLLEIQSQAYNQQYGTNFVCVIPTNIYGPHDNFSLEDGHVIPSLIHKCFLAKQKGEPFVIRGTGKPLRQFIYSTDLAKLILWVLEHYTDKDSIILSVNETDEVSIRQVGEEIAKNLDYLDHIQFDSQFSDGQYKKTADNSKLKNLLPSFEFTPLPVGVHKTVSWFIDNYESCRK